jgi:type II secretory pathway component GspD/PulD (secretin)
MRFRFHRLAWTAGILGALTLTPAAQAQGPSRVFPPPVTVSNVRLPVAIVPTSLNIGVQTNVTVPDGGTASLGGYGRVSEGRSTYGPPVLSGVPLVGRGVRNSGYGRSVVNGRVTTSVRIISLREEEYRQTGVVSP